MSIITQIVISAVVSGVSISAYHYYSYLKKLQRDEERNRDLLRAFLPAYKLCVLYAEAQNYIPPGVADFIVNHEALADSEEVIPNTLLKAMVDHISRKREFSSFHFDIAPFHCQTSEESTSEGDSDDDMGTGIGVVSQEDKFEEEDSETSIGSPRIDTDTDTDIELN